MNKENRFPITGKFKLNKHGRLLFKHDNKETVSSLRWNARNLIGPSEVPVVVGGRIVLQEDKDNPGWFEFAGLADAKALCYATERNK